MAYYLTIKEKNNYKLLDITSLEEFTRFSNFKNNSYSLEEVDFFTSIFNNEIELKKHLYENGIISIDDIVKKIEIRIKLNGKLKKVKYDLIYKSTQKYLDVQYLRGQLLILQHDKDFLKKLLDYYRNSHKQEGLRQINALLNGYHGTDLNMFKALCQFLEDEIITVEHSTGEAKLKYKSLHDLAMFIYNYCNNKGNTELDNNKKELARVTALEELKKDIIKPKTEVHVKKKIKKPRQELEGQTSFF